MGKCLSGVSRVSQRKCNSKGSESKVNQYFFLVLHFITAFLRSVIK